jgi:hypothetical protein
MHGSDFEEEDLFRSVEQSGVRAVLFGRRALIVLGLPVQTFDYDFWIDIEEIAKFNAALEHLGLYPNHPVEEARKRGRYVLENDMRVDVLVARADAALDGTRLFFEDVWRRRQLIEVSGGVHVALPSIDDLIVTKRFAARGKDAHDIHLLEVYRAKSKQ